MLSAWSSTASSVPELSGHRSCSFNLCFLHFSSSTCWFTLEWGAHHSSSALQHGLRAGCCCQDQPGSPCDCGGLGEGKNLLSNNNAFVCARVGTKGFLKLPEFSWHPQRRFAAARVAPLQPWKHPWGCSACGQGTGICCPRARSVSPYAVDGLKKGHRHGSDFA